MNISYIKSIITITLSLSCIFTTISFSTINLEAKKSRDEVAINIAKQQSELVDNLPNGKKQLKKKLALEYTNTKFETDLSSEQKLAILQSLKKWKGELPVNNTFTVTSLADIKSNTNDNSKQSKKKNSNTPNSKVVYMWASIPNPNWDNSTPYDAEDYEEGDPRFIRVEFNTLLKQSQNGSWKASIENSQEVKVDAVEVIETSEDAKVIQDLFATDMIDNRFTADTAVLVDSDTPSSQVSSSTTSSSQQSLSISSNTINSSNSLISSTKTGFLESILGFGAVKASAGNSDYSWPWKSGDKWATTRAPTGWHECPDNYTYTYANFNIPVTGCALDLVPVGGASTDVLAPKSATIRRACKDSLQGFLKIDQMYILHLDQASIVADNTVVNKAQKIGTMYNGAIPQGTLTGQCGWSTASHIHIKFGGVTATGGSFAIDGTSLNYATNNNSVHYTSQNVYTLPPTTPAKMNLKVNLGGAYNKSVKLMNNNLRSSTLLPTSQPYNTSPWNYSGSETYSPQGFNTNAVDWVLIEIRNWSNGAVVERKAAQIDRFGNVYESNGSQLSFANITTTGSFKVIVRHRNHLPISTSVAIGLSPSVVANLDFTNNQSITGSNQVFLGTNSTGASTYGLRFGDINKDGSINSIDKNLMLGAGEAIAYTMYDINLDSYVDAEDRSKLLNSPDAVQNI